MSYDIAAQFLGDGRRSRSPPLDDGGMAYVATPGLQGIYAVQGEQGTGFVRFVTPRRRPTCR